MSELCYVCTLPFTVGQPVYWLVEDDGTRWLVHSECMAKMQPADQPSPQDE